MTTVTRALLTIAVVATLGLSTSRAQVPTPNNVGHPLRGTAKWTALLCHYSDETPPRVRDYYVQLIAGRGVGGFRDYLQALSRGLFDHDVAVHGWFTISKMLADRGEEKTLGS